MSVLGYVKAQRVPGALLGEDETFQAELRAIRNKLAAGGGAARPNNATIYRAGVQPKWAKEEVDEDMDSAAAAAGATAAASSSTAAAAARASKLSDAGGVSRARRVDSHSHITSASAASSRRVPFAASVVAPSAHDDTGRDEDGDERMGDDAAAADEEDDEEERGRGRHREGDGGRRRKVEAAIIVAAPAAASSFSSSHAAVAIDTSALEVPEPADDEEDEETRAATARRARARANAVEREAREASASLAREQALEEAKMKAAEQEEAEAEEEEEEDDDSEYESDSEDERRRTMLKPVFRSKAQRDTAAERERLDAEEAALEADRLARKQARKKESKLLVLNELQREVNMEKLRAESAAAADFDSDSEPVNAEAMLDEEYELNAWKLRELRRIKRDRLERKQFDEEQANTERRRNMSDAEVLRDNAKLGIERVALGERKKGAAAADGEDANGMRFMQRYYHKGAFFTDEASLVSSGTAELLQRDFQQPTGADRTVDKTTLPAVMQVKKFAMKGRTKYTHLVDQDTTRRDENPWSKRNTLVEGHHHTTGAGEVVPDKYARKKQRN